MGEIGLAVRSLLKSKLFTATAIITLVIGVGTSTAVFTFFHAVVLRPLPFPEQERLVDVEEWSATELCGGCAVGVSHATLADLQPRLHSLGTLAAYMEVPTNIAGADAPERVGAARVSGDFFHVLGVLPVAGRTLHDADARLGAPPVVVLSERFLNRRFGGDRGIVGQPIRVNGVPTTVVGVMGPTAVLPEFAQMWLPLIPDAGASDRSARDLGVIGRLRAGATIEQADAEVKVAAAAIAADHPDTQKGWSARARSLRVALAGNEGGLYQIMLGAVLVLWAIVCANLAGLILARGLTRKREVAVRLALGARRSTIVWHLLAESLCISIVGGVVGLLVASWTIDLLVASVGTEMPQWIQPRMDAGTIGFAVLLSLVSAAAFGLVPALRATRPAVQDDIRSSAPSSVGGGKSTLRGSLVVLQLTLSLVLLAASGVLSVAMNRIGARQQGADDHDVVQARIELLGGETPHRITTKVQTLVARFTALPEARSAAAYGTGFIAGFGGRDVGISAEGVNEIPEGVSPRFFFAITPRYFETIRMSMIAGRGFAESDAAGATPVVVINRRLASHLWPGLAAIGRRLRLGADSVPWRTVVGVVSDIGDSASVRSNYAYVPFRQAPQASATILVAARGEPATLIAPVREAARAVDADLPLLELMTASDAHARAFWAYRVQALIMSAFGAMALVLAAVGLYGVVAYGAEQRTREIGVRVALGATRSDVVRLVTRQGMRLVIVGVAFGLAAAAVVLPVMKSLLFNASPYNPVVFSASAAILIVVALLASYLPARRAVKTDPMVALRTE